MGRNSDVKVNFLGDADSLARAAARSRRELDQVDRHAHTVSAALGTAVGTIAGRAIGGVASAAVGGIRSVAGLASASITAASSLNETLSKNEQVFGSNAKAVEAWARDSKKNILLTVQAGVEGAATFGNLFGALGISQASAAKMSTTLVGLASDLSSFSDVDTSDALRALQSGVLGEAEPLRKFGVSLSEARVQAEAYALGLAKPVKNAAAITAANNAVAAAVQNVAKVEKEHGVGTLAAARARDKLASAEAALTKATAGQKVELTDAQKVQARESIILKDTAKAHGDAARTSGQYANSLRIFKKAVGDTSAVMGTYLLPYATRAVQQMSKLVTEFENGTGTGGHLRDTLKSAAGTAKALGDAVLPVVKFLAEHPKVFFTLAGGVVAFKVAAGVAAFKAGALGTAIFGVRDAEVAATAVAPAAEGAMVGLGAAASAALGEITLALAAAYAGYKFAKFILDGLNNDTAAQGSPTAGIDLKGTPTTIKFNGKEYYATGPPGEVGTRPPPVVDDSVPGRGRHSQTPKGTESVAASAKATEAAGKKLHDTQVRMRDRAQKEEARQKYAADQLAANEAKRAAAVEAAAERKRKAAAALEAATQKIRDALQARKDMASGIRDDLVSSNGVLREGLSYTAKDLLTRFRAKLDKVKQFSAAISAMVHKGYAPSIVQQVAAAGVDGLATAKALAAASAGQVKQFSAVDAGIQKAAQYAGDRTVTGVLGATPIHLTSTIVMPDGKVLATVVNNANAQASGGRPGVRTR